MSATTLPGILKKSAGWSVALSVVMILAGVLAIALPFTAALAVNIVVGWLLLFAGAAHFAFAWHIRHHRGFFWQLILGVIYIVAGGYLLLHPLLGLLSLALALAIYLFAEGIFESILAFHFRPHAGWGWLLFDGIITLILGVMIWRLWPSGAAVVIGTLVGISMIFSGVSRLMLSLAARRALSHVA